jgi:hypothetical protein
LEIAAIQQLLTTKPLSLYDIPLDQWMRNTVNYILTDHGRLKLIDVAEQLGVSKSYLSDIVSRRWKTSMKVPLRQIIEDNLPLRPEHFGHEPLLTPYGDPHVMPAPDLESFDDATPIEDDQAGLAQAELLTDGSPQSFEYSETCKSMLFNLWEHPTAAEPMPEEAEEDDPQRPGRELSKEVITEQGSSEFDFSALELGEWPVDDDDELSAEEAADL